MAVYKSVSPLKSVIVTIYVAIMVIWPAIVAAIDDTLAMFLIATVDSGEVCKPHDTFALFYHRNIFIILRIIIVSLLCKNRVPCNI